MVNPKHDWETFSNVVCLSLKLLLSGGPDISSNKWHFYLFFNEDSNILPMISHLQPQAEHKVGKKRPIKQNNFTFYKTNVFL